MPQVVYCITNCYTNCCHELGTLFIINLSHYIHEHKEVGTNEHKLSRVCVFVRRHHKTINTYLDDMNILIMMM